MEANLTYTVTMLLNLFVWTLALAYFLAQLEIQIEGKYGWAEKLPTWRFSNRLTDFVLTDKPLTGYHLWQFVLVFLFFHFPFAIATKWGIKLELIILSYYFFLLIFEDFLWFVLNPNYGIGKFKKEYISWHKQWIWIFPKGYYKGLAAAGILFLLSIFFQ